jgi:hypothetical protein
MKTLLIMHYGAKFEERVISKYLASFSDLTGIVIIKENKSNKINRIKKEFERKGIWGLLDVALFRIYYNIFLAKRDELWLETEITKTEEKYDSLDKNIPIFITDNPNSLETEQFINEQSPDITIARCKQLLTKQIFDIPRIGTFVLHPGICPEYRNSHGCYWAIYNNDFTNIGMTLLKIDDGIDTGPIYGYYRYSYTGQSESHIVIQRKVISENLKSISTLLNDIYNGTAKIIDVKGRKSAIWGQPTLSSYIRILLNSKRIQEDK